MVVAAGLLAGCQAPDASPRPVQPLPPAMPTPMTPPPATQAAAPADPVVASVGTTSVRMSELQQPLMQAYGFNMLMLLVQRDMARDACSEQNIACTPADVKWEYDWTLNRMFEQADATDDREKLLDQYLAQPKPPGQMSTRAEWNIIVDTNAHLRKLVEPTLKKAITDDMLHQQFDEEYGAQAHVRDIQISNPQERDGIMRRLAAGEDFAAIAREVSRDPNTKRMGGELAPFAMHSTRLPEDYKRVVFAMKPGDISDPVLAAGGYHVIKLERIDPPKAVKFDDVKDGLRQDYEAKLILDGVKGIRNRLAQQAVAAMKIDDPTLKTDFEDRLHAHDGLIRDREKIRLEMEKQRNATTAPTTAPAATATATATAPAVAPAIVPAPAAVAPPAKPPVAVPVAPAAAKASMTPATAATHPAATGPSTRPS